MRVSMIALLVTACCTAFAQDKPAEPQDKPEELKALEPAIAESEAKAVEAIRALGQENEAKIKANEAELALKMQSGDSTGAQELQQDIARRYALMRQAYQLGLDHFPNNAKLHNYLGEVLYDGFEELEPALKEWNQAIGLDPKFGNPYNNLGLHYVHYGEYKRGLEYMDKALELDDSNPDYLFNMVQIYLVHGPQVATIRSWEKDRVYKEAMKMSKKALKEAPEDYQLLEDYAVNFWKAEDFGVDANWKDAALAWQGARAQAKRPDQVFFTWLNEGRAWLLEEDQGKAVAALNEALKLHPDSAPAKNLLEKAQALNSGEKSGKKAKKSRKPAKEAAI
ncbi:MAG: hypothetical protein HYZ00_05385 [Candidatus Hydrogenedentes bacterium]|nr:hypothetical protein [Candidatus Hydrogenedentota bacterium]